MSPGGPTLALVLLLAGCRSESGGDRVAGAVRSGVMVQLGVVPVQVGCARDRCAIDVAIGDERAPLQLQATVTGEREAAWQTDEVVLAAPLATYVTAQLADLGLDVAVDCGAPVQPVPDDGRMTCRVGDGGVAWVRLGPGGDVEVEVALSPEAIAARVAPTDDDELDRASRALDTDEAEGSDGDGDDDQGRDAGVEDGGGGDVDAALPRGARG